MQQTELLEKKHVIFYLGLLLILGLGIRFYYFPYDVPIATDGFFSFVYAVKTVFEESLPVGYTVTNTGWSNFLSLFFMFSDTSQPLHLMHIQRSLSIVLSSLTIIPAFFIFKRFVNIKFAIFGCFLLAVEPRLLLISLEGINFSLFFFLFVSAIALFLNKTNVSLFLTFVCIACASLVRYEAILLIIPFSIMFFVKFKGKKTIWKFLGIIFVLVIILVPISILRIQATEEYCHDSVFGVNCGKDGIISNLLDRLASVNDKVVGIPDKDDPIYNTNSPMIDHFLFLSVSYLVKFLGLVLVPFFIFFVILRIVLFIRKRKLGLNFDQKVILSTTCIMLLPAIYAYGRGIEEVRYVLIIIPIVCILSISGLKLVSDKISKNRNLLVISIVAVLILSIMFIESEKRDVVHNYESLLVGQEIIKKTSTINSFNQDGYMKAASLINSWPELPNHNEKGKLEQEFIKIRTSNYDNVLDLIIDSKKYGLKYLVIDQDDEIFYELRKNPANYPYLDKKFDSKDYGYTNNFKIYEINYRILENEKDG